MQPFACKFVQELMRFSIIESMVSNSSLLASFSKSSKAVLREQDDDIITVFLISSSLLVSHAAAFCIARKLVPSPPTTVEKVRVVLFVFSSIYVCLVFIVYGLTL